MRAAATHRPSPRPRRWRSCSCATRPTRALRPSPMARRCACRASVDATFLPAGHVLGSAQILLEHAGEAIIVTGDFKRRPDPTCTPFQVTPCDVLITEATFGLPVFRHPPVEREIARLLDSACRQSHTLRARRRLRAWQGAAADRRAAAGGLPRHDLAARRDGADVPALRGTRRRSRRPQVW